MRRLLAYRSNRRTLVIATVGLACLCGAATWTALGLLHGREPAAVNEPPTARTFRLTDGTEIPVEEWGETYEAWERGPVIETAKARTVRADDSLYAVERSFENVLVEEEQ